MNFIILSLFLVILRVCYARHNTIFWKKYSYDLTVLSKIARKVLAIPATSATVERFLVKLDI
jgi:hypothetical protein